MVFLERRSTLAAGLTVLLIGCSGGTERPGEESRASSSEMEALTASRLAPEAIAELKERYPTLREERAPEPQPTDGASSEVPKRVREALPGGVLETVTGDATFYADKFEGRRTASGIPFRQNQMVAAHRAFPFGTLLRVTNLDNGRAVNVRVVDRGPFGSARQVRRPVIDLSRRAATDLGYVAAGRASVRIEVLEWGEGLPRA